MKFKRKIKLDTKCKRFKVGDTFSFKMNDGEKVEVIVVKKNADGNLLCIFENCLKDKYTMNQILNECVLRQIYDRFPSKIKNIMVAFDNGDMLRLPSEKEIFGENEHGEFESDNVKQFKLMKSIKNRIAFQGKNGDLIWYWLQNKVRNTSATHFALVNSLGFSDYFGASFCGGVRPIFLIKR